MVVDDFASFATQLVVRIRRCPRAQLEEVAQILRGQGIDLFLIVHDRLQTFLGQLTLKNLFFHRPRGQEAIRKAAFGLSVTPTTSGSLFVHGGVPVRIKQDETIGSDQVETAVNMNKYHRAKRNKQILMRTRNTGKHSTIHHTKKKDDDAPSTGFATQQERNQGSARIVEFVHHLLSLLHGDAAIESTASPRVFPTHASDQVEGLRVIADDDDLVIAIAGSAHLPHQPVQDEHLTRPLGKDGSVMIAAAAATAGCVGQEFGHAVGSGGGRRRRGIGFYVSVRFDGLGRVAFRSLGYRFAAVGGIFRGNERRMIAEFHEHLDRGQTIDLLPVNDVLQVFGGNQMLVHVLLNVRQVAAHDLDQFGWQVLRVERIDASEDELVDETAHVILNLLHLVPLRFRGIGFASTQNGEQGVLAKVIRGVENSGVGKVDLWWGACETERRQCENETSIPGTVHRTTTTTSTTIPRTMA